MLEPAPTEGKRVLVADDERHLVRLIQVHLQRQGYEVTCAFDGREAIARLERQPFDRAILDLMMPYVGGQEVLEWIRTHEATRGMWVALMTAQAEAMRDDPTLRHRADLYVPKPFDPADVLR